MVGGFFTGWATSSSQWIVDVIGESEGQNFWCYALEEEWKMGNCMKFRLSLRKEFGNCTNNIRQEGRVFKFMYWGMWMMDSLEVLCFNFFFQWRKKKWSAELGQGRGCWGLKSEKMSNTCLVKSWKHEGNQLLELWYTVRVNEEVTTGSLFPINMVKD